MMDDDAPVGIDDQIVLAIKAGMANLERIVPGQDWLQDDKNSPMR